MHTYSFSSFSIIYTNWWITRWGWCLQVNDEYPKSFHILWQSFIMDSYILSFYRVLHINIHAPFSKFTCALCYLLSVRFPFDPLGPAAPALFNFLLSTGFVGMTMRYILCKWKKGKERKQTITRAPHFLFCFVGPGFTFFLMQVPVLHQICWWCLPSD